jgi:hypothetical protein
MRAIREHVGGGAVFRKVVAVWEEVFMTLPGFGAERSLEKSTAKYEGQYVHGVVAGGPEVPPAGFAGVLERLPAGWEFQSRAVDDPIATMQEAFDVPEKPLDVTEEPVSAGLDTQVEIRAEESEEMTPLRPDEDLYREDENVDELAER